jgi:hypothetical protein
MDFSNCVYTSNTLQLLYYTVPVYCSMWLIQYIYCMLFSLLGFLLSLKNNMSFSTVHTKIDGDHSNMVDMKPLKTRLPSR